jgi:hypothetical protein
MVRPRRLELPRAFAHNDLNVARLPIPPWPHAQTGRSAAISKGAWGAQQALSGKASRAALSHFGAVRTVGREIATAGAF